MDMDNGISLYPGLDNTPAENLALLEEAAHDGIRRIFTSLHIPETDVSALKQEIGTLLERIPCEGEMGAHLHLEMEREGRAQDPLTMLEEK